MLLKILLLRHLSLHASLGLVKFSCQVSHSSDHPEVAQSISTVPFFSCLYKFTHLLIFPPCVCVFVF